MLHGCKKTVIHLSETDSEMFDEAYFILRGGAKTPPPAERDMVKEANRLLERAKTEGDRARERARRRRLYGLLCFLSGALSSAVLFLCIR
ncbi:MAG: hypothetical protein J6125_00725 [Clostridia bacterium]|nr:hypothetical protein [Clostridia bacterium]